MINLKLAGALERSTAFSKPLTLMNVARIENLDHYRRPFVLENIVGIKKSGGDKGLLYVLYFVMARSFLIEKFMNSLRRNPRFFQFLLNVKKRFSIKRPSKG